MNNKKIGIAGVGMVGKQVERWFEPKENQVFVYDKFQKLGSLEDLNKAEIIFLCLPTPYRDNNEEGTDLDAFKEVIRFFKEPKIFVIKSTVPVGSTDKLQEEFSQHYFLHSPEFLTEVTAWDDFSKPYLQLIGYTEKSKKLAEGIMDILPKGEQSFISSAKVTEMFKFIRNVFPSIKIIFMNLIYDLCGPLGIEYDEVKKIMAADKWIGTSHLEVVHKGYRGFGGKCLPKDLRMLIKLCKNKKVKADLLEIVDKVNYDLLKGQGLEKKLEEFWLNNHNQ
ncbi:MAG: hypothetical protein PHN74_01815 [Candidatus Pacebacteria bacterium]|nr:hypothetical protein [Candidatus Paceibacterota bacterium]